MVSKKSFWLIVMLLLIGILLSSCIEESGNEATPQEGNDETEKGSAGELEDEQVLNIIEGSEIPAMDSAIAEDIASFNVLNNVNEGLYRLNQENIAEPLWRKVNRKSAKTD